MCIYHVCVYYYTHLELYSFTCVCLGDCVCERAHESLCLYMCLEVVCVCVCVFWCVCVYLYLCVCVCIYVCMCVCVFWCVQYWRCWEKQSKEQVNNDGARWRLHLHDYDENIVDNFLLSYTTDNFLPSCITEGNYPQYMR